jgi:hypothetical protein
MSPLAIPLIGGLQRLAFSRKINTREGSAANRFVDVVRTLWFARRGDVILELSHKKNPAEAGSSLNTEAEVLSHFKIFRRFFAFIGDDFVLHIGALIEVAQPSTLDR